MAQQQLEIPILTDELLSKITQTILELEKVDDKTVAWGKNMKSAISTAIKQTSGVERNFSDIRKEVAKVEKETVSYEEELAQLEKLYKALTSEQKAWVKSGKGIGGLKTDLKTVENAIKKVKEEQKKLNDEADELNDKVPTDESNPLVAMGTKATKAFKAFIALEIVGKITEFLSIAAEVVKQTELMRKSVAALTDLEGDALDSSTARIKAISDTFGVDFEQTLIAINARARQTGETFEESLTQSEIALTRGKVKADEYLEVIKEYPTFLKRAGIEGQALNEALELGFVNSNISDRTFQTFEEGTLRLGEFTQATEDAINFAFGPAFTAKLKEGLESGELTIIEALQSISTEITTTELNSQQLSTLLTDGLSHNFFVICEI